MSDWIVWIFFLCSNNGAFGGFFGLTYKEINALVFWLLQPSLIILFATLWIIELRACNIKSDPEKGGGNPSVMNVAGVVGEF